MDAERLRRAVWLPPWSRLEEPVGDAAVAGGVGVYAVGGFVRDLLLERSPRDLDLTVVGDGIAFARGLAARLGEEVEVESRFLTARIRPREGGALDVSTARSEFYPHPGALPEVEPASIREDLERRDFTVNTFAVGVAGEVEPGLLAAPGAERDLEEGRLRVLHPRSFDDDPTRILRGVALESRLGFRFEPETEAMARRVAAEGGFDPVSGARLWQDLDGPLERAEAPEALGRLEELGVLRALDTDLEFDRAGGRRLRAAFDLLEEWEEEELVADADRLRATTALVAMTWELPAEARRRVAKRLALPAAHREPLLGEGREEAEWIAAHAEERPSELHARLGGVSVVELAVLAAALGAPGGQLARRELAEWRRLELSIRAADLLERGVPSGPAIGRALERTRRARLDGRIEPADELQYALGVIRDSQAVDDELGEPRE